MNETRGRTILIAGAALAFVGCAYFGQSIPFEEQWPLFEALRTTAAIVFAVIGAWLSVIYPRALQTVFSKGGKLSGEDKQNLRLMVEAITLSTFILATVMFAGIAVKVLHQIPVLLCYKTQLRAVSFGLLGALTFMQFWTLIMTLAQAHLAKEEIEAEQKAKTLIAAQASNVQYDKRKPPGSS